jgi:hypothetical protein
MAPRRRRQRPGLQWPAPSIALGACLAALLCGCVSLAPLTERADAGPPALDDAGMDAGLDPTIDGGDPGADGDAPSPSPSDAGLDTPFDAPLDTPIDVPLDAPVDVRPDVPIDAPLVAPTDAGRDAPLLADAPALADVPVLPDAPLLADAPVLPDAPVPLDAPLPPSARLVINEIDYDQPMTDAAEFMEIYNAGSVSASLDGIAVILVNGASNTEYSRATLSGTLAPGEYVVIGVIGQALPLPVGVARFDLTMMTGGGMQNGAPDGVALIDTLSMTVLDRFSYEGSITAASIFGRSENLVEGTAFPIADSDTTPRSLCRRPNGTDTDVANADWSTCTPSPGAAN